MFKLLDGVINFHETRLPGMKEQFALLAEGQSPDALMVACADSRVVPNLFASTNPGDLFVVRNPGNLIPPLSSEGPDDTEGFSEVAALELALARLRVRDIIVCGHSRCAGMAALLDDSAISPAVKKWMRHGKDALLPVGADPVLDTRLSPVDQLSQLNVLCQLAHLQTYPLVEHALAAGALRLHGWWFDIVTGNVHYFEPEENGFLIINRDNGDRIKARLR